MSDRVAHWYHDVEQSKRTPKFESRFFEQFKKNFTNDLHGHLKHEPHHPYKIDFFSAKMPRGDDIAIEEFLDKIVKNNDRHLVESWSNKQFTVLRLNKSCVPKFGENSTVINIIIDSESCAWLNRARRVKLFGKENGAWISKENHPDFLKYKYKTVAFKNQYRFEQSDFSFIRHHIVNEPIIGLFRSVDSLIEHASNQTCAQLFLDLSDILDKNRFRTAISALYEKINLGEIKSDLIDQCYDHYHKTNIKPFIQ